MLKVLVTLRFSNCLDKREHSGIACHHEIQCCCGTGLELLRHVRQSKSRHTADSAAIGGECSHEHGEQARLARAIRPNERKLLARL